MKAVFVCQRNVNLSVNFRLRFGRTTLNPDFGINSAASLIHPDLINPFEEPFRRTATHVLNIILVWRKFARHVCRQRCRQIKGKFGERFSSCTFTRYSHRCCCRSRKKKEKNERSENRANPNR